MQYGCSPFAGQSQFGHAQAVGAGKNFRIDRLVTRPKPAAPLAISSARIPTVVKYAIRLYFEASGFTIQLLPIERAISPAACPICAIYPM